MSVGELRFGSPWVVRAAARKAAVVDWEGTGCTVSSLVVGSKIDEPVQAWRGGGFAYQSRAKE